MMKRLFGSQRLSLWALVFWVSIFLSLAASVTGRRSTAQVDPRSLVGEWSSPFNWPIVAMHTHVLPNGKVLVWQGVGTNITGGREARVWEPATNSFTQVPNNKTEVFCSGHAFLPNGNLLVTGGHISYDADAQPTGSNQTNIFNFSNNRWSRTNSMNAGRWYPTNTSLANGEVLVVSGAINSYSNVNTLPQVWKTTGGWRNLTGAQQWLPLYPWMFVAPNGSVFNSGPNQYAQYLNTTGNGAWSFVATSNFGNRDYGSSVMYDNGKVLIVGGANPPTNTAEVINLNDPAPQWRYINPMANARRQLNATILPDGNVLVTGGSKFSGFNNQDPTGAVLAAEMWNPQSETWSTMASMQVPRLYHSSAVLLADGRVLSGGGGQGGGGIDHYDVEFYSPPYLFKGARPAIASAPSSVGYNQRFFVQTPDAANINKVTWVRLSSVTHAINMNQRFNNLPFLRTSSGLNVTSPASGNLAPPGHYMLFLINANGVPSVAKIIKIT